MTEQKQYTMTMIGLLLIFLALGILVALFGSTADAQVPRSRALLLAQVTIHEAGWEDTGDMEAIDAVFRAGAERSAIRYESFANSYSGRIWSGATDKPWVRHINERCNEPAEWPTIIIRRRVDREGNETFTRVRHASWSVFRERCVAVMARAREVVAGERVAPCAPHDWGGRVDRERAARIGLVPVSCDLGDVETRNDFYLRPSLITPTEP